MLDEQNKERRNLNETDNAALETWFTRHHAEFSESLDADLHQRRPHPERNQTEKRNLDRKDHRAGFSGIDV